LTDSLVGVIMPKEEAMVPWNLNRICAMCLVACLSLVLLSLHPAGMFGFQSGEEHYVLIEIGEKVGDLRVKTRGKHVDIDFKVDDNGRGAKYKEKVDLDTVGLPTHWEIEGVGWMALP